MHTHGHIDRDMQRVRPTTCRVHTAYEPSLPPATHSFLQREMFHVGMMCWIHLFMFCAKQQYGGILVESQDEWYVVDGAIEFGDDHIRVGEGELRGDTIEHGEDLVARRTT